MTKEVFRPHSLNPVPQKNREIIKKLKMDENGNYKIKEYEIDS